MSDEIIDSTHKGSRRWFGKAVLLGAPVVAAAVVAESNAASANTGDPWIAGGNASAATDSLGTTNATPLLIVTGGVERMRVDGTDGRVGLGTVAPAANTQLHVSSATKTFTARIDNSAANGVSVLANATGSGGRGVTGQAAGTGGSAIAGYGIAPGTGINGVYGESQVANGRGVKGVATASGGEGVRGEASSTSGGWGIHGIATGGGLGVFGEASGTGAFGANPIGVLGRATGAGVGVRGEAPNIAIFGVGATGVYGQSNSVNGWAVDGANIASGTGIGGGVRGFSAASTGVHGEVGIGASGPAVRGLNPNPGGVGVRGEGSVGLSAETSEDTGYGIHARNLSTLLPTGFGVAGRFETTGLGGIAVLATAMQNGTGIDGDGFVGVRGRSALPNGAGVAGFSTGASGIAISGTAVGTNSVGGDFFATGSGSFAGRFGGNVQITGSLSKGSGTFKIDHPQDPENRYLVHSFVESPEMKNMYDGVVICDVNGGAVVVMPSYFESLNRTFRYQLTAVGQASPNLHIADKIVDGRFRIAGGAAGLEVSWMVTGVRQDVFAEANPIVVELDKAEADRGMYLHPDLFGFDESRRIGAQELVGNSAFP
jgi:hypothetical protein